MLSSNDNPKKGGLSMRQLVTVILILVFVLSLSQAYGQLSRKNQFEIYAGAGFPLGPDYFKDYYKVGLSLNVQYVAFPTMRLGIPIFAGYETFSVDNNAISDDFASELVGLQFFDQLGNLLGTITSASLDAEGSASSFKVGIGLRPYLTSPEASTQIFLFGNASYNWLREKGEFNSATSTVTEPSGNTQDITLTRNELSEFDYDEKDNKFGVGIGAGIEIPASSSINLIFQGLYNIIFTKESDIEGSKNLSFVGVTAGIVF
jgi:opacity protein-like surface antigen